MEIAFDILALDGDDLRKLPLSMRKANLQRLLARRPDGIFLSDFEQGEIGPDLFRKACEFGFEGGLKAKRSAVSRRSLERLDQGQEPEASGNEPRDGCAIGIELECWYSVKKFVLGCSGYFLMSGWAVFPSYFFA